MDLTERFKELKEKKEDISKKRIETEVKISNLEQDINKNLEVLKEKYGVNSLEEAQQLYYKKKQELDKVLDTIDKQLKDYEDSIEGVF